jgi:hypothetical protein
MWEERSYVLGREGISMAEGVMDSDGRIRWVEEHEEEDPVLEPHPDDFEDEEQAEIVFD